MALFDNLIINIDSDDEYDDEYDDTYNRRMEVYEKMAISDSFNMNNKIHISLFMNLLFFYNQILIGEIDKMKNFAQLNFKVMIKKQLPNANQLSYWVLTKEKNKEEYPYSFVVFVSGEIWQNITAHMVGFYATNYGQNKKRGVIYENNVTHKSIIGLLMIFFEQYLAVFFTIVKYGHSSTTTKEIFLQTVNQTYEFYFGKNMFPKFVYNKKTNKIAEMNLTEVKNHLVWTTSNPRNMEIWDKQDTMDLRIDLDQRQCLK